MVEWLTTLRRASPGSVSTRERRPALRAARKAVRRALWRNRALILARRGELAAAERAYARATRAARARFDAAEKARIDALREGRAAIETLRGGRQLAAFRKLCLYADRLELPDGTVALSQDVTAVVGVPAMLAAARPEAIRRLGATKDERRLLQDLTSETQRTPYLFVESRAAVAAWSCKGQEEAAQEFAARVNVAALNAEQAQRELREEVRRAEQELWRVDAELERAALEAFSAYQQRRTDTRAVDRARRELEAALSGGEEIERLRAGLVQLASE